MRDFYMMPEGDEEEGTGTDLTGGEIPIEDDEESDA